ncbi:MAG: hypothetical protein A2289_26390 [Deltaproteobacteria bacterium RIFOXYA12_FULL_58_15]|nr:MAG: hypothetical protein A2289_26390 [Deltaproteobacteria bacterium RIFOXYA12_FULL_58_15]
MRTWFACLCGLLLETALPSRTWAQTSKIAVLDFTAAGVEDGQAKDVTTNLVNLVAAEVGRLGFEVISTADINAMLSYEKQKDLVGCEENTTCLAEIGGALGVDMLLGGSLGKLGDTYTLSLSLVDIKTGAVKKRFHGEAGDTTLLSSTAKRGVAVLFGKEEDRAGFGTVVVKTDPPGASLFLDEVEVGVSPTTLDNVRPGEHSIEAKQAGLSGKVIIEVRSESIERISIKLQTSPPVKLKIISSPPEASVFFDGEAVGQTPVILPEVRAGKHRVRLEMEEHLPSDEVITVSYDEYEKGGRVPIKYEATLTRKLFVLPVELVAVVGSMAEIDHLGDGVSFTGEVAVGFLDRWEVGLGVTLPIAVYLSGRFWAFKKVVELGAVARVAAGKAQPGGVDFVAAGGGLALGWNMDTLVGRVGLRWEGLAVWEDTWGTVNFPVTLAVVWRLP